MRGSRSLPSFFSFAATDFFYLFLLFTILFPDIFLFVGNHFPFSPALSSLPSDSLSIPVCDNRHGYVILLNFPDLSKFLHISPYLSRVIQNYPYIFQTFYIFKLCLDLSIFIHIHPYPFQFIPIYPDASRFIQVYPGLSRFPRTFRTALVLLYFISPSDFIPKSFCTRF